MMKKTIVTLSVFSLCMFKTGHAQIKVSSNLNLKGLKQEKATNKTPTESVLASAKPAKKLPTASSTTNSSGYDGGWSNEEVYKFLEAASSFTDATNGGWMLNDFSARASYSSSMKIPVVEFSLNSKCMGGDARMLAFRMKDKNSFLGFNFAQEAQQKGKSGTYKSETVILKGDEYVIVCSYMDTGNAKLRSAMVKNLAGVRRLGG